MVIYDGETCLQLILDNPPSELEQKWKKARIEFYKRIEPNAVVRDQYPIVPPESANHRIRFTGAASDAIYKIVYGQLHTEAFSVLDELANKAAAFRFKGQYFVK